MTLITLIWFSFINPVILPPKDLTSIICPIMSCDITSPGHKSGTPGGKAVTISAQTLPTA